MNLWKVYKKIYKKFMFPPEMTLHFALFFTIITIRVSNFF